MSHEVNAIATFCVWCLRYTWWCQEIIRDHCILF